MSLSAGQKFGLALLAGAAVVGIGLAIAGDGGKRRRPPSRWVDDDDDDDDDLLSLLRPGRRHEFEVMAEMKRRHPRGHVLDNPVIEADDGSCLRPDVVVLGRDGRPLEVREAKDVNVLRSRHVLQALGYDSTVGPLRGTTLDIAAHTLVPTRVAKLAELFDIALERHA